MMKSETVTMLEALCQLLPAKPLRCKRNNMVKENKKLSEREIFELFNGILDKKLPISQLPKSDFEMQGKGIVQHYKCPVCTKKMPSDEKGIHFHIKNHLFLACKRCKIIFFDNRDKRKKFLKHMSLRSSCKLSVYKCPVCENVSFGNLSEYTAHAHLHSLRKVCDYCSEVFPDSRKKYYHTLREHKDKLEKFFCDQCAAVFVEYSRLKVHSLRVHGGGVSKICPDCGAVTSTKHTCLRSSKEEYICAYCSKVFTTKMSLIAHISAHMNLQLYQCKSCNKGFNRESSLTKHVKDMHSERKWRCTVGNCGKSYSYKSALETHMLKGHRIKLGAT